MRRGPLRALFIAHSQAIGGAERSLTLLIEGLAARGWECEAVVPAGGPLAARLDASSTRVHVAGYRPVYWPAGRGRQALRLAAAAAGGPLTAARIRGPARAFIPDVVHVNGLPGALAGRAAAREAPSVWHVRELYGGLTRLLLRRAALGRAERLVFISRACRNNFDPPPGGPPAEVVPNGIPVPPLPSRPRTRGARIGIFSQLVRGKGHGDFLQAASLIAARRADARFSVFGHDPAPGAPTGRALLARARALGIADRIEFAGFTDQPERAMERCDLMVLAATEEPSGRVLLEAMAHGCPVVAAAGGGVPEIIVDGETGVLFEPGDSGDLARSALRLLGEPRLAESIRLRAHHYVRSRHGFTDHVDRMEQILTEAASPLRANPRRAARGFPAASPGRRSSVARRETRAGTPRDR